MRDELLGEVRPKRAVAVRGRMVPGDGYQPENHEHLDVLTEVVNGRREGKDPLKGVTPAQLAAAGHPYSRASEVASRYARDGGVEIASGGLRLTNLRERVCLDQCQPEHAKAGVRRCAVINCPVWPYRLGKNPHNSRRGWNPFAVEKAGQEVDA